MADLYAAPLESCRFRSVEAGLQEYGGPLAMMGGWSDLGRTLEGRHLLSWGRTLRETEADAEHLARAYGRRPKLSEWLRLER